jgi:hypothetical protein
MRNMLTTKMELRFVDCPRVIRAGDNNPPNLAAVLQDPNAMSRITVGNISDVITYRT